MRGLHTSLVIVVAAIVILIVALIVLTIFGVGVSSFSSIAEAKSQCITMCQASCRITQQVPLTWKTANMRVAGAAPIPCSDASLAGVADCTGVCAVSAATGGGTVV